jgi:alkylation response protein AidB-like acyl-CoA dehydrogenase
MEEMPTMELELSETHRKIHAEALERARPWAGRTLEVRRWPLLYGTLHPGLWQDFCAAGGVGAVIPRRLGGGEQGLLALTLVMEAFASQAVLPALGILTALGALILRRNASEELQAELLPRVARGDMTLAVAVTEMEGGQSFHHLSTLVERCGERVRIHGEKAYTLGADVADRLLVVGRSRPPGGAGSGLAGLNAVVVDPRTPGLGRSEISMGARFGLRQWRLRFDECEVPASRLVGEEHGAALSLPAALDAERLLFCAWALGTTAYCLERAVERARARVVSGDRPLGIHQAVQHPLAEIEARLAAARLLTWRTAARFDAGVPQEELWKEVYRAKVLTADLVWAAADQAVQTFGGAGFDEEEGLIQLHLDARSLRINPLSQEVALSLLAQHVLGLPRSS